MATIFLRATLPKTSGVVSAGSCLPREATGLLTLLSPKTPAVTQVAGMKATYGEKYPYAKPWPYKTKKFNLMHEIYDSSLNRINENSKVIAVEGNIAVGKNAFAKSLAQHFDLKYFPSTPDSDCFTRNPYKFDIRSLDEMLPETAKSYDLEKFLSDPNPHIGTAGKLQLQWYEAKFYTYVEGLKHLLNTGQGVVFTRSVFSDMVFAEAMRQMNWLTPKFLPYYYDYRDNSLCELLKPHLTIYLDAPVNVLKQRIKERGDARELNSSQISDGFLRAIEKQYKERLLPQMRASGAVMELDWTEVADELDIDEIVEEIQLLQLHSEDNEDFKFQDWNNLGDDEYAHLRKIYFSDYQIWGLFNRHLPFECPEIMPTLEDNNKWIDIVAQHPCLRYDVGWSPDLGHKTLFKLF